MADNDVHTLQYSSHAHRVHDEEMFGIPLKELLSDGAKEAVHY